MPEPSQRLLVTTAKPQYRTRVQGSVITLLEVVTMSGCTGASKFLQLREFCGTSGLLNVMWTNNDTPSRGFQKKTTDWHRICRRLGRSVSDLLVCRISFLCRCVHSCLSRLN